MYAKFFLFAALTSYVVTAVTNSYETKYDGIDLDEILKNERLLNNYVKCLMSEGPCTPDGFELKESLPDAIQTECSKCSEKQRIGAEKVTHYLIDNKPEQWERLGKVYDKDGEYRRKYLATKEKLDEDKNDPQVSEEVTHKSTTE